MSKLPLKFRLTAQFVLSIFLSLTLTLPTFAALPSEAELDYFNENGIYYYNPASSNSADCSPTGNNTNYAGEQVWTDGEMALIELNQPFYEEVAAKYGFDWQFLAVIHSMESGLSRTNPYQNNGTPGEGVYQLHSIKSQYPDLFQSGKVLTDAEFLQQTELAAQVLTSNNDLTTDGGIKRAFFKYNGTASVYIEKALAMGFTQEEANNGDGSYYVMNRYDAARDPASPEMSPLWPGRFVSDGVYDPSSTSMTFGAYTKFAALGGGGVCTVSNNIINETALNLAWPVYGEHANNDPSPAYLAALKETGLYNIGGLVGLGASCDVFVATVMRVSGVDPDFPCCGVGSTQYPYLSSNPAYQSVGFATDSSIAQPGDIRIYNGHHIELVVQLSDGTIAIASASNTDRTAEVGSWYNDSNYEIFRHI